MPRSDVATGGLTAALAVLIGLVLNHTTSFDFSAVEAAFAAVITFGAGYYAGSYKPLVVAVVAPVASVVTVFIGYFFFAVPIDEGLLSTLLATIAGAVLTYRTPPYDASPLDIDQPPFTQGTRRRTG